MEKNPVFLKKFSDFPTYTDPGSVNQFCEDILPRPESFKNQVSIGTCRIQGPGRVAEGCHTEWTQYFVVLTGRGTLHYDGQAFPLRERMIARIPLNTRHYVECRANEKIEYLFFNQYIK